MRRELTGYWKTLFMILGVAATAYHITALGLVATGVWELRVVHLMVGLTLTPLLYPAFPSSPKDRPSFCDVILVAAGVAVSVYPLLLGDELAMRQGMFPTTEDVVVATILVLLILEYTRRAIGWPLIIVAVSFILYALTAAHFPGILKAKAYTWPRLASELLSMEGVYGSAIGASSTFVYLFVLFGAVLKSSRVGEFFIDLSYSVAGRSQGGPAKVAIFASGLFGTIAGSGPANVVTTGSFTIPLMIRTGLKPAFAGAVEAAASAGGGIMPPIMGAAAFLMAELINVQYGKLAVAAALPAGLFYLALFLMIHNEAGKMGLQGLPASELPKTRDVMKRWGHLSLPIVLLVYMLAVQGVSPIRAALTSIAACIAISWVKAESRMGARRILEAMVEGAKGSLTVILACAAAGIVMTVINLTGLGLKLATGIMEFSGGNLFPALVLTMLVTIVLSMGLPTVGAYIISGVTLGTALTGMGLSPLLAHMFIFYFASMSGVTPPVALNAFPAAGIAGADPFRVGLIAWRLSITAFIVPYMFVYAPSLLLIGDLSTVLVTCATACAGVWALAASLSGWTFINVNPFERIVYFGSAFALIFPGLLTDLAGFGLLLIGLASQFARKRRLAAPAAE